MQLTGLQVYQAGLSQHAEPFLVLSPPLWPTQKPALGSACVLSSKAGADREMTHRKGEILYEEGEFVFGIEGSHDGCEVVSLRASIADAHNNINLCQ